MNRGTDDRTPVETVIDVVTGWPGVTREPHPYDGVEFHLGDYEFGHVHHGWQSLHVNYPRRMRDALIEEGHAEEHPYFSNSGWTNHPLRTAADVEDGRWLLRLSYLYRASTRRHTPAGEAAVREVDVAAELDDLGASTPVREPFEAVIESAGRSEA